MRPKIKRRKTPIWFVHKIVNNLGAFLFIFNRYLIKILLIVGICAGLFYMCSRVEQYQQDDSKVVAYKHAHPSEMGKGRYQRPTTSVAVQPVTTYRSIPAAGSAPIAPPKEDVWLETTDFSPDMQPFLPKEEPLSFIQSEVRARMEEIEKNVLEKRK